MELKQQVLANALPHLSNGSTHLDNNQTQLLANSSARKDNTLDNTADYLNQLLANIEPHLWESFQTRLEEWWSNQNSIHQQLEDLQKQVQELTVNLQEMYQLWQDSIQSPSPSPPSVTHEKVKETTTPVETNQVEPVTPTPVEFPNPQQTRSFVFWTQQQREQHNGSWKPVVEWLNQHQITTPTGRLWTSKSLSDFVRKRKSLR